MYRLLTCLSTFRVLLGRGCSQLRTAGAHLQQAQQEQPPPGPSMGSGCRSFHIAPAPSHSGQSAPCTGYGQVWAEVWRLYDAPSAQICNKWCTACTDCHLLPLTLFARHSSTLSTVPSTMLEFSTRSFSCVASMTCSSRRHPPGARTAQKLHSCLRALAPAVDGLSIGSGSTAIHLHVMLAVRQRQPEAHIGGACVGVEPLDTCKRMACGLGSAGL